MSNRRLRRAQERLLKNPKKLKELMKLRPPTEEDIEWYAQRKAASLINEGTKLAGPIQISDEMAQQLIDFKEKRIMDTFEDNIKEHYNTK
jgi:hypothetical protein